MRLGFSCLFLGAVLVCAPWPALADATPGIEYHVPTNLHHGNYLVNSIHDREYTVQYPDERRDDPMAPTRLRVYPTRLERDLIATAKLRVYDIQTQLNGKAITYGRRMVLERQLRLETANLNELLAAHEARVR